MTDLVERPLPPPPVALDVAFPAEPTDDEEPPSGPPPVPPRRDLWSRLHYAPIESWLTFIVVAGCVLVVLAHLAPEKLITNTTPTGGDLGAQVWGPAYLRDHLLPHGRLSGWAPDWYGGFSMYQFYMVVPALLVVLLDVVLPYAIALKFIVVLGTLSLPVCMWAFGRANRMRFPMPALMAVGTVFFLFDDSYTIYGGNIASTMAGEYSFSLALSFCVLYFAALSAGLRTGKYRGWAALLFALTGLCHAIVFFYAVVGTLVMWLLYADRKRFRYVVSTSVVAGLLMSFWMLPFFVRRHYMTDMGYEKISGNKELMKQLWFPNTPGWDRVLLVLALLGFVGSLVRWRKAGAFLGVMALIFAAWMPIQPQAIFWNARLLPMLHLCRYALAGIGVAEIGYVISAIVGRNNRQIRQGVRIGTLATASLAAVVLLGMSLRDMLPGGHKGNIMQNGKAVQAYKWGPFSNTKVALAPFWAKWGFSGYEEKPHYGEYRALVEEMASIGDSMGCGRAMYENNNDIGGYGTSLALMLLPFWTDGCIGSMEGLYFEASATTPYHFVATSAMSENSSDPVRKLNYTKKDAELGVQYLRQLGVRYYLAFTQGAVDRADREGLAEIAQSGPWHIYEIDGSDLVVPLTHNPVVAESVHEDRLEWLDVAMEWFQHPETDWSVPVAASGPEDWTRIALNPAKDYDARGFQFGGNDRLPDLSPMAGDELPTVNVTDVKRSDDRISFTVDKVGVPVLVKESYFPNWKVSGAKGPYRVAPNQMVVIPTKADVSLHYGRTGIDYLSILMTLGGIVALVALWRRPGVEYPVPPAPEPKWTEVQFNPPNPEDRISVEYIPPGSGVVALPAEARPLTEARSDNPSSPPPLPPAPEASADEPGAPPPPVSLPPDGPGSEP